MDYPGFRPRPSGRYACTKTPSKPARVRAATAPSRPPLMRFLTRYLGDDDQRLRPGWRGFASPHPHDCHTRLSKIQVEKRRRRSWPGAPFLCLDRKAAIGPDRPQAKSEVYQRLYQLVYHLGSATAVRRHLPPKLRFQPLERCRQGTPGRAWLRCIRNEDLSVLYQLDRTS
jgi:hypothetical protein